MKSWCKKIHEILNIYPEVIWIDNEFIWVPHHDGKNFVVVVASNAFCSQPGVESCGRSKGDLIEQITIRIVKRTERMWKLMKHISN